MHRSEWKLNIDDIESFRQEADQLLVGELDDYQRQHLETHMGYNDEGKPVPVILSGRPLDPAWGACWCVIYEWADHIGLKQEIRQDTIGHIQVLRRQIANEWRLLLTIEDKTEGEWISDPLIHRCKELWDATPVDQPPDKQARPSRTRGPTGYPENKWAYEQYHTHGWTLSEILPGWLEMREKREAARGTRVAIASDPMDLLKKAIFQGDRRRKKRNNKGT